MQQDPHTGEPGNTPATPALQGEALARRRALLAGLSKGGAAAGVLLTAAGRVEALPGASTAPGTTSVPNYKTTDNTLCSISGQQSAVLSRAANSLQQCSGNAPSYFVVVSQTGNSPVRYTAQHWPTLPQGVQPGAVPFSYFYGSGFPASGSNALELLATTQPEAYWVAAYLNALLDDQSNHAVRFPFTTIQLKDAYAAGGVAANNYLAFIKKYLSV